MKKFISFVMAGAMVASLVPATAFAKGDVTATAKIVDALEKAKDFDGVITKANAPELQLKVTSVDYTVTNPDLATMDVELTLDNAEFKNADKTYMTADQLKALVGVIDEDGVSVLGTWRDNIGAGVTATAAPEALDTTDEIAAAIKAGTALPSTLGFYKDADKSYSFITAAAYAADHAVGAEKATPTLEDRQDAAFVAWLGTAGITVTAGGAPVDGTNWETYYNLATWNGNAAYILKTGAGALLTGAVEPVYVSDLTIAPASTYSDAEVLAEIKAKLDAAAVGHTINTVTVSGGSAGVDGGTLSVAVKEFDKDSVTYKFTGFFQKDDKVIVDLASTLTKTSEGTKATVSVDSKMVTADDLTFASILGKGLKVSVKKTVDVATDEVVTLNSNGLKIESSVGNFSAGQVITLKLNNGFEFVKGKIGTETSDFTLKYVDEKQIELTITSAGSAKDEITLKDTQIEATTAKSGAVATITAKSQNVDSASCEVAKVVDYKVSLTVDADEDVPVIYSGTDVANAGLTDDSDHYSLEVTAKETFPGAWSMRQGFNFNLPEGVYVTDVKVTGADNFTKATTTTASTPASRTDWEAAFKTAYQDGDHKNFEFKKRVFNDVDTVLAKDPAELTFELQLVADPTFEGDVKLTFEGALVDKQEVTIAKFVKPYTVKAEQNDVIIDYRNTEVKTPIVITEAEEGLWKKDATFKLNIEDDLLTFENDPTFTIDKDSDMKLKDDKADKGTIKFSVKEESDKAATVTISDMKLFMSRSIPAGAYDLEIATTMSEAYDREKLYAPDEETKTVIDWKSGDRPKESDVKKDSYVDDVCDYSDVVKAAFINVVTSGRDNDNLFTTKVVVPVGEAYLLAGEANNVLWNAETRTVTVMYAQRIITMTVGQKTIYVNGSAIPASAAPEIKDGRTFLPLRDLGTALGVTNVNWDAATKTATLN